MKTIIATLALVTTLAAVAVAQPNCAAPGFYGIPLSVVPGQFVTHNVSYWNCATFRTQRWDQASIVYQRIDGALATGNLLTNGQTISLWTNGPGGFVLQGFAVLATNHFDLPPNWAGVVSDSLELRMQDLGTLTARGETFASGGGGGSLGHHTTIVQGVPLRVAPSPLPGYSELSFVQPAGVALKVQARFPAGWRDVMSVPSLSTSAVTRCYVPSFGNSVVFRVSGGR